jgi:hypothetical protein
MLQEHVDTVEPGVTDCAAWVTEATAEVGVPEVVDVKMTGTMYLYGTGLCII